MIVGYGALRFNTQNPLESFCVLVCKKNFTAICRINMGLLCALTRWKQYAWCGRQTHPSLEYMFFSMAFAVFLFFKHDSVMVFKLCFLLNWSKIIWHHSFVHVEWGKIEMHVFFSRLWFHCMKRNSNFVSKNFFFLTPFSWQARLMLSRKNFKASKNVATPLDTMHILSTEQLVKHSKRIWRA